MQLVLLAAVVAIGWYGYRSFVREAERVNAKAKRQREEMQNKATGTLIQDPKTGEYRPAREDD